MEKNSVGKTAEIDYSQLQYQIDLLKIYTGAISEIWGYYFIVVLGTITLVATLIQGERKIDYVPSLIISTGILLFAIANFGSLYETKIKINEIIYLLNEAHLSPQLDAFKGWTIWFQFAGYIAVWVLLFLKTDWSIGGRSDESKSQSLMSASKDAS